MNLPNYTGLQSRFRGSLASKITPVGKAILLNILASDALTLQPVPTMAPQKHQEDQKKVSLDM
jgi:hypothetical protein